MTDRPDDATMVSIYTVMARIKKCDERVRATLMSGQAALMYYPVRGQEAIPAGLSPHLSREDYVVTTYRGLHDQVAKGVPYKSLWAEYLGRVDGTCKGKGGPMHITDASVGLMVTTGVVGSGLPIANGLALASLLKHDGRVSVVNFGDGATNIGAFHEALNMASLWKLPVIFVCQNNLYGEHTAYADAMVNERVADRAAGYGMLGVTIDGNDPVAVWRAGGEAITRARNGDGPTLLEAVTYRHEGHFFGDSVDYMTDRAEHVALDPYPAFRKLLADEGIATVDQLVQIESDIDAELDDAVRFAFDSPFPDIAENYRDVYAEEVRA